MRAFDDSVPLGAVTRETVRRIPGEGGFWFLIFGDLLLFSVFFVAFLWAHGQNVALFIEAQSHVNQLAGMVNTLILLTSSWFVVTAVRAARVQRGRLASNLLWGGIFLGAAFAIIKLLEYREKFLAGFTPNVNDFFNYYYLLTGLHFVHVILGMGVLAVLSHFLRSGAVTEPKIRYLECGASFWHLVDLLWIVLFALLYLLK